MSEVSAGSTVVSGVARAIHRLEVRARMDPRGESVRREAVHVGVHPERVRSARVYLIAGSFTDLQVERIGARLLADPVLEELLVGTGALESGAELIEVHPLPGVMDPAAQTVRESVEEFTGSVDVEVVTGWRYDVAGVTSAEADELARRLLANEVIEAVHREAWWPEEFPHAAAADQTVRHVEIRGLDDGALERLSREGHLFLSLEEMRAIRSEYERAGREPTDVELETLAQTWSEHCVHKTLKSTIRIRPPEGDVIDWSGRPGHEVQDDGSIVIHNLLKSTVAAATHELMREGIDWALSVFVDNAGVIAFDEEHAVCVKVETHNHPSAIEPYGGAATGVGGVIRDIIGTGLGARPVANTDVFCVADPRAWEEQGTKAQRHGGTEEGRRALPAGCLHPRRVLTRVVDGVRDYGNRMGIPTVNGAVFFDDRYVGNPLVFCGCVGVMARDMVEGDAVAGDRIIAVGGRTGRDGIHGATFSSAELTDTHADEFSHAVQIGNPIEEKRTLDAILLARDHEDGCLYSAITDCGAGGFSSAVGEMGERLGAEVELSHVPLKYAGLRYDEIWISESQERMVLAVAPGNVEKLRGICAAEHVEMADLGVFGTEGRELVLRFEGAEVGRIGMEFLHEGIPMPVREAEWGKGSDGATKRRSDEGGKGRDEEGEFANVDVKETLLGLLAHRNIASKRWIVRQYDHEVQGGTVVKPLVGASLEGVAPIGPSDAAVIQPVAGSKRGLAIGCGLAVPVGDPERGGDPYLMALAAVDECVRNLVCVGADPERIAILDNFCWASCAKPENLGALVRAAEGCYDAAKAYRVPFISGKDSLNNQFRTESGDVIEIPPTLLITGVGVVEDVAKCVTMDLKPETSQLVLLGCPDASLAGSHFEDVTGIEVGGRGRVALRSAVAASRTVAKLIDEGFVLAAHDASEGGVVTALAEMAIAGDLGLEAHLDDWGDVEAAGERAWMEQRFGEGVGRYLVQVPDVNTVRGERLDRFREIVAGAFWRTIGDVKMDAPDRFVIRGPRAAVGVGELRAAFEGGLDW